MSRRNNQYMGSKIQQKKMYYRSVWGILMLIMVIGLNLVQFVWTSLLIGEEFTIGWGKPTCIGTLIWGPYITMMLSVPLLIGGTLFYIFNPKYRTDADVFRPNFVLGIALVVQEILALILIFY